MSRMGLGSGYWIYQLYRYLRNRQRQKQKAARESERKSWEAVRRLAAKAHHNTLYSLPFPSTIVLPTKIPLPNQYPRTILTLERRGEESGQ